MREPDDPFPGQRGEGPAAWRARGCAVSAPATAAQRVSCPVCGHSEEQPVCRGGHAGIPVSVAACRTCGLVLLSPRESKAAYTRFYETVYSRLYRTDLDRDARKDTGPRVAAQIRPHFADPPATILDIGAGSGSVLEACRRAWPGSRLFAVEPDASCRRRLQDVVKADVVGDDVDTFDWGAHEKRFDLVILRHVLEHTFDPVAVLRGIRRVLSDRGLVYVAVPNLLAAPPDVRLRTWWFRYYHTFYFTEQTLRAVTARADLSVAAGGLYRAEMWLLSGVSGPVVRPPNEFDRVHAWLRRRLRREWGRELLHAVAGKVRRAPRLSAP